MQDLATANLPMFTADVVTPFHCVVRLEDLSDLVENHLKEKGKKKSFESGSWHQLFYEIVRQGNKYCTVMFTRHHVNVATKRRARSEVLFRADAYVQFNKPKIIHDVGETTF